MLEEQAHNKHRNGFQHGNKIGPRFKPGESGNQGVGYLEDGTMVVVESARDRIGQDIALTVTSSLQTSAGRMIFGRIAGGDESRPLEPGRPLAQKSG